MVRTNGNGGRAAGDRAGVAPPRRPELGLPELSPYAPEEGVRGPVPGGDYDGLRFEGLDLSGTGAEAARFLECGLYRCALDGAKLGRVRLLDSEVKDVSGVGTDLAGAELRDVEMGDVRLGGAQLHGSRLTRVLVRGGKIDFLNARQAVLQDVTFENCVLVDPDFGGTTLERVSFTGCVLRGVDFSQAVMRDVDLRGVAELGIAAGTDRLSGAVISTSQLVQMAPVFAAQLGVRVLE